MGNLLGTLQYRWYENKWYMRTLTYAVLGSLVLFSFAKRLQRNAGPK